MYVIGVVQLKGGAGRSTVASNLAVGLDAVLLDADAPQFSASAWGAIRDRDEPPVIPVEDHRELVDQLHAIEGHDFAIVDAPPRVAEVSRALLLSCDLALVPVAPSIADIWAVQDLLETVAEAHLERPLDVRLVWNKLRPYVKGEVELQTQAKRELDVPSLRSTLSYRVAYSQAFQEGLSVLEYSNPKARDEMQALVREVRRIRGKSDR